MKKGYIELSICAEDETAEALADFLFSEGALGLVTEDPRPGSSGILIRASFPESSPVEPIVLRLSEYFRALAALRLPVVEERIEVHHVPVVDWAEVWKAHFQPLFVGRRLIITPPWEAEPFPHDRLILRIDPGMSFGTGHHGTTRMCLEFLERCIDGWGAGGGPDALDVGTGTGILAIAAARLGAERVVALDTDRESCDAATSNLGLNGCADRVRLIQGRVEALNPDMRFDIILANLDTKALLPLFHVLRMLLTPRGRLVASGMLVEDEGRIGEAAAAAGFPLVTRHRDGEWLCLTLATRGEELDGRKGNAA